MSLTVRQRTALTDGLADAFRNVEQLEDIVWRVEIHPDQPALNPRDIIRQNPTLPQAIKDVIDYFDSCNRIAALVTVALGEVGGNQKLKDAQALLQGELRNGAGQRNEQLVVVTQVKDPRPMPMENPDLRNEQFKASRRKDLENQLRDSSNDLDELELMNHYTVDPLERRKIMKQIELVNKRIEEIEEKWRKL
ncbi:MAG: effector-associated domain EAD1-containing protein [Chloroflexota bacterium]